MSKVINLFRQITNIPRCSKNHQPFIDFMRAFSSKNDYECYVDDFYNILCKKAQSKATLVLQSHYDIVCLEDNTIPQIIEEDGFLKAKDSTLGADNGIGCAMMMALMQEQQDCEFLFTSDEEIGLIGANNLQLELQSSYMLNLDSEALGEICIGCAGGIDIFASMAKSSTIANIHNKELYEISIDNLAGGHSGVDIDKNIPNAIKLLAQSIKECGAIVLDINGGQRINSIPKSAKAIVVCDQPPQKTHENMNISKIDTSAQHYTPINQNIIDFIYSFANGVRGYNKELKVVQSSINLAIIQTNIDEVKLSLSARSMNNDDLALLARETVSHLQSFGFQTSTNGKYPAWNPHINDFTKEVLQIYKKHLPQAKLEAIHAGLECAIFKDKYPNILVASIGPNIYFPHSNNEKVEIDSIDTVYKIVQDIVAKIND